MLKTDYKNDVLDTSVNDNRKYEMTNNSDGTISLTDVTVYSQEGSLLGANDINATNERVNQLTAQDGLDFRFATDGEGNYGYLGADDSFIPFKSGLNSKLLPPCIRGEGGADFESVKTNLNDGNYATKYSLRTAFPKFIFEFEKVVPITLVKLYGFCYASGQNTSQIRILGSNDDINYELLGETVVWTTKGQTTAGVGNSNVVFFQEPQKYKYYKADFVAGGGGSYCGLYEAEFY